MTSPSSSPGIPQLNTGTLECDHADDVDENARRNKFAKAEQTSRFKETSAEVDVRKGKERCAEERKRVEPKERRGMSIRIAKDSTTPREDPGGADRPKTPTRGPVFVDSIVALPKTFLKRSRRRRRSGSSRRRRTTTRSPPALREAHRRRVQAVLDLRPKDGGAQREMAILGQRQALMEQQMAMLRAMVADTNATIDLIANESGSSQATPDRDTQALSLFKDPPSQN